MTDQDQTTSTTGQTNSDQSTSTTDQSGSSSSTTDQQSQIDLAGGDDDDTSTTSTTDDTRTPEEKAAEEARAELFGAPAETEDYSIEGLPEGMEIDKEALDAVTPTFRELGLSSKGASKVAAVYAEQVLPKVMERATQQIEQQVLAQRSEWENEARAAIKANGAELKNAGGEQLTFDGKDEKIVLSTAAKALDHLAPVGFRQWLKDTGLSQNPFMVAFTYQAGKLLAEDRDFEEGARTRTQTTNPSRIRQAGGMDPDKFYPAG